MLSPLTRELRPITEWAFCPARNEQLTAPAGKKL